MRRSLGVLLLGLASACLLWEGAQCRLWNYWLTAPPAVSVPLGLCVIIPCNFSYNQRDASRDAPLYGYWFEKWKNVDREDPVATNNPRRAVESYSRNRFTLSKHLDQGDCSLTIKNATRTDQKKYFFRVEKAPSARFSYNLFAEPYVNVTELGKPEIRIPGELRAGQPVNITCTAPASCPLMPPNMTWEGISEASTSGISAMLPSGSDIYTTVFNFSPSAADHGKVLTCSVSYGKGPGAMQTAETILLNVHHPPQTPQFSGELIRANGSLQNFSGVTQIRAQKGDSVALRCEVEGNPVPSVTWVRGARPPQTPQLLSSENELKLSNLTQLHEGKYECRAQNSEGSSEATFLLSMKYSPKPCNQEMPHCWSHGTGFQCNCSFCAFPSPKIKWQVDGETLEGNTAKGPLEVTTWTKEEVATSTLHFTGLWNGKHRITCLGSNPKGELPVMFFLLRSAEDSSPWHSWLISGVTGAIVTLALTVLIIAVVVTSKRCQKGRKSVTGSSSYTEQPTADQSERLPPPKDSHIMGGNEVLEMPEKTNEAIYSSPDDPGELHYASLQFNILKTIPESLSEEPQTEYAEIKAS